MFKGRITYTEIMGMPISELDYLIDAQEELLKERVNQMSDDTIKEALEG